MVWTQAGFAHEAFGDLGPFHQALLHPVSDPAQGLLVAAASVLLVVQLARSVRAGLAALALASGLALLAQTISPLPAPGGRLVAALVIGISVIGLLALHPGPAATALLAAVVGMAAAFSVDVRQGLLPALLTVTGRMAGIVFGTLFLWGAIDVAARRPALRVRAGCSPLARRPQGQAGAHRSAAHATGPLSHKPQVKITGVKRMASGKAA